MNKQTWQSAIEKTALTMDEKLVAALNHWRLAQRPVPSPTEAIELLLVLALTYEGVAVGEGEPLPPQPSDDPVTAQLVDAFRMVTTRQKP